MSVLAHRGVIKLPCMKVSVPETSHYIFFFSSFIQKWNFFHIQLLKVQH